MDNTQKSRKKRGRPKGGDPCHHESTEQCAECKQDVPETEYSKQCTALCTSSRTRCKRLVPVSYGDMCEEHRGARADEARADPCHEDSNQSCGQCKKYVGGDPRSVSIYTRCAGICEDDHLRCRRKVSRQGNLSLCTAHKHQGTTVFRDEYDDPTQRQVQILRAFK